MDNRLNQKLLFRLPVILPILGLVVHLLIGTFGGLIRLYRKVADSDFVRHILPVLVGFDCLGLLQFNPLCCCVGGQIVL